VNVYCQYFSECASALHNIVIDSSVEDACVQMLLPVELHSFDSGSDVVETGLGDAGSLFYGNFNNGFLGILRQESVVNAEIQADDMDTVSGDVMYGDCCNVSNDLCGVPQAVPLCDVSGDTERDRSLPNLTDDNGDPGSNTDNFISAESTDLPNCHTKCRKRVRNEEDWVRNKRRKLRNGGQEYVNSRGKVMAGKKFRGLPSFCCRKIVVKGCLMRIVRHCLCNFGPLLID